MRFLWEPVHTVMENREFPNLPFVHVETNKNDGVIKSEYAALGL